MNFLRIFLHTILLGLFLLSVTGCAGQIGSQKALKDDWNFTNATNFNKGREAYKNGDYATALKKWTPLAEKGFARAQMDLGVLYFKGQGVQKDDAKAMRLFRVAAEQGYSQAQNGMGVIYMKGEVVSQDYITAIKWFKLAAEQGNAVAQKKVVKPSSSVEMALPLFCERLIQDFGLQTFFGVHFFKPPVFLFQFFHSRHHGYIHATEFATPLVEGGIAHAMLPAQLGCRSTRLGLF